MTFKKIVEIFDLVDEMQWEDSDKVEKISLEDANFEEINESNHGYFYSSTGSILSYLNWFYDGEQSEFDM